jgi:uncharacterized protein with von Willebrand factor type A (vWA) domain
MFITFLGELRAAGLPVSITEYLTLLQATEADLAGKRVEDFYFLARTCLVKDETGVDKFDRVFAHVFKGLDTLPEAVEAEVPTEWLLKLTERWLSDEDKAKIASLGGLEKLLETLRERLAEQKGRHQGGSKWIGTGGTSPFGHGGYNPEGIRIGGPGGQRRAVKVWEKREFKDLDDTVEIGTRAIKIALRRLRRFARTGAAEELDLEGTIGATARRAFLDVRMRPERHNAVKVLLLLDIGGSMDDHVRVVEELFSAARSEFKHLEHYYFHNCLYEGLWKSNRRRRSEQTPTAEVLRTFPPDTRVVVVGDAAMSPYEISHPGGAVEHWNAEAGAVWLQRLGRTFPRLAWINPLPERHWAYTHSVAMIRDLVGGRMYPMTLDGLDAATRALSR